MVIVVSTITAPLAALAPSSSFEKGSPKNFARTVQRNGKTLSVTHEAETHIQEMDLWLWTHETQKQFETISLGLVEHKDAQTDMLRELVPPRPDWFSVRKSLA